MRRCDGTIGGPAVGHASVQARGRRSFRRPSQFLLFRRCGPGLVEELWKFAKSAYLDSPLPSLFKERLFVHLSRFCEVRYCIVRHVGFLIGQGRPAGDADATPETIDQVMEMLRRPLPEGAALTTSPRSTRADSPGGPVAGARTRVRGRSLRRADDHVPVAARYRPRTHRGSRRGGRDHVRAPRGLSRLHSDGSLLDRESPRADLRTRHGRDAAGHDRARGLAARHVRSRTRPGRCAASRNPHINSSASRWRWRRANHGTRFCSGSAMPQAAGRSDSRFKTRPAGFSPSGSRLTVPTTRR